MALVTSNDETFRVSLDNFDVETFSRRICQDSLEFSILAEHDLTLVGGNEESAFWKPTMSSDVRRKVVILFLWKLTVNRPHAGVLFDFEILVGVIARNENTIDVCVLEWDLCTDDITRGMLKVLMCDALLSIDLP